MDNNPYSPSAHASPQPLAVDRRLLRSYWRFHEAAPSGSTWITHFVPYDAALTILLGLLALQAYFVQWHGYALLIAGVILGVWLRDFALFLRFWRTWPTVSSIIDWQHVEEMLTSARPLRKGNESN